MVLGRKGFSGPVPGAKMLVIFKSTRLLAKSVNYFTDYYQSSVDTVLSPLS